MAAKLQRLDIVSVEEKIFSGDVEFTICTGELGELGIHPGHLPLMSPIKPGHVKYRLPNQEEEVLYISGGILEVQPDVVTILADTIIRAEDLDEAAAIDAKEKAEQALSNKQGEIDFAKATAELVRAAAQIHAIREWRKRKH